MTIDREDAMNDTKTERRRYLIGSRAELAAWIGDGLDVDPDRVRRITIEITPDAVVVATIEHIVDRRMVDHPFPAMTRAATIGPAMFYGEAKGIVDGAEAWRIVWPAGASIDLDGYLANMAAGPGAIARPWELWIRPDGTTRWHIEDVDEHGNRRLRP